MDTPNTIDRLLLLILAGVTPERAAQEVTIPAAEREKAITEARRRLTLAADFNRDEALGTAISRLNDLYTRSLQVRETHPMDAVKVCMSVQKELNRLLDLYRPTIRHVDANAQADKELEAVRSYLLPLNLAPGETSTAELARLSVAEIVSLRHASK